MVRMINLGGKERPIRYSHRALRLLSAHIGANSFSDLGEKIANIGVNDVAYLAFVGLQEGARFMSLDPPASEVEVESWLDDETAGIFQRILEAFTEDFNGPEEKKEAAKGGK